MGYEFDLEITLLFLWFQPADVANTIDLVPKVRNYWFLIRVIF